MSLFIQIIVISFPFKICIDIVHAYLCFATQSRYFRVFPTSLKEPQQHPFLNYRYRAKATISQLAAVTAVIAVKMDGWMEGSVVVEYELACSSSNSSICRGERWSDHKDYKTKKKQQAALWQLIISSPLPFRSCLSAFYTRGETETLALSLPRNSSQVRSPLILAAIFQWAVERTCHSPPLLDLRKREQEERRR